MRVATYKTDNQQGPTIQHRDLYFVKTYKGKESEKGLYIYIYIYIYTHTYTYPFMYMYVYTHKGFPVEKNLPANAGDARDAVSIPGSGKSPGGGNGNPLQYSCLEKSHGQRRLLGYSP